jgi:hypothetical protein
LASHRKSAKSKSTVAAKLVPIFAEEAKARQEEAGKHGSAGAKYGREGGRGKKKNPSHRKRRKGYEGRSTVQAAEKLDVGTTAVQALITAPAQDRRRDLTRGQPRATSAVLARSGRIAAAHEAHG